MTEGAELRAADVLSRENLDSQLFLTKAGLERKYGKKHEIVYFLEDDEPHDRTAKQQAVLKLAKETGGWVFTGIHRDTDWSETRWWNAGWHICNRTGEYAVVKGLNMTREAIQKEIADWIDTAVIANGILDTLTDQKIEVTTANAQKVWLDFLTTELNEGLQGSVSALAEKGEILYV